MSGPLAPPPVDSARVRRYWVGTLVASLAMAALLLGAAGTLAWPMAWVWVSVSVVGALVTSAVIEPDLMAERAGMGEGTPGWDKLLAPLVARLLPAATLVVAGLDRRWDWSGSLPRPLQLAGLAVLIAGLALVARAMTANRFFAATMRIQPERGHVVVDGGPYARIRHPGYAGMVLYMLATPLALGSLCALGPGALTALLTVLRTALEDRALRADLAGYRAYAERVRFRLLPGLW